MRYDLLQGEDVVRENLSENEFFDVFTEMFPLRLGCRISSACLLNSTDSHRFAFLSEDTMNQELPSKVRITPYLHERRVYLRNRLDNKRYFNTAMEMPTKYRDNYN